MPHAKPPHQAGHNPALSEAGWGVCVGGCIHISSYRWQFLAWQKASSLWPLETVRELTGQRPARERQREGKEGEGYREGGREVRRREKKKRHKRSIPGTELGEGQQMGRAQGGQQDESETTGATRPPHASARVINKSEGVL